MATHHPDSVPIGIVVCSDRASRGVYQDKGGPAIESYLRDVIASPWHPLLAIVSDERENHRADD